MAKPMTRDEFEDKYPLDYLPEIYQHEMSIFVYNAYVKGFNQKDGYMLNSEEFEREYPVTALQHLPKIIQNLTGAYAYIAYIKGYNQFREENRQCQNQ